MNKCLIDYEWWVILKAMKIPRSLNLPDKALQGKLNTRLRKILRPWIKLAIYLLLFLIVGITLRFVLDKRWTMTDEFYEDTYRFAMLSVMAIGSIISFFNPEFQATTVIIARIIIPIFTHAWMVWRFEDKEICAKPVNEQIKHFVII